MTTTPRGDGPSRVDAIFATGRRRSRMLRRNGVCVLAGQLIVTGLLVCTLYGSDWTITPFHVGIIEVAGGLAALALLLLLAARWVEGADVRYLARRRAEQLAAEAAERNANRAAARQADEDLANDQADRIDRWAASLST